MNKDQNVNDILDMLRQTVSEDNQPDVENLAETESKEYSEDALKKMLKEQFFTGKGSQNDFEISSEYKIDADFLQEAKTENDSEIDAVDTPVINDDGKSELEVPFDIESVEEDNEEFIVPLNTSSADIEDLFGDLEKLQSIANADEDVDTRSDEEAADIFFAQAMAAASIENTKDDFSDEEISELLDDNDGLIDLQPIEDEDAVYESDSQDYESEIVYHSLELGTDPVIAENDEVHEANVDTPETEHETYLASVRKTGLDFQYELPDNYTKDAGISEPQASNVLTAEENKTLGGYDSDTDGEELDLSTINLMMQFCDDNDIEKEMADKQIEKLVKNKKIEERDVKKEEQNANEYLSAEQNSAISQEYRKKIILSFLSVFGCVVLSLIATLFDFLPLVGKYLPGVLDYQEYPSIYVLIGLQFVIFTAAIHIKALIRGVKNVINFAPNRHSLVAAAVICTVLYDISMAIALAITDDDLPPFFNALTAILITMSVIVDHLCIAAEKRSFAIYSSDDCKYTLVNGREHGTTAKKMYAGGLSADKSVYTIEALDFPNGFYHCINDKHGKTKLMNFMFMPAIVIAIIVSVISVILDADFYSSATVFMIAIFTILPITWIYTDNVPKTVLALRLSKRGSAIAGSYAIRNYEKCDIMVFSDLHMFKKCKTHDVGIAMYDTDVGYLTLGCLDALFSKIGGPLSGMEMKLPEVFKFDNVDIRRITRNGIEAIVDRKHAIIVGERSFMQRYGIIFPDDEKNNGRSTLCVSLNGGVTAKLSVKYETEPVFEMLVERLHAEGVACAIETYDPLINSEMIINSRTIGDSSISVVHKNSDDFRRRDQKVIDKDPVSVVACGSRLKLAEIIVWIKRVCKIDRITTAFSWGFSVLGLLIAVFVATSGIGREINEYYLIGLLLIELFAVGSIVSSKLPNKQYFTTAALSLEIEKDNDKKLESEKKTNHSILKNKEKDNITEGDTNE